MAQMQGQHKKGWAGEKNKQKGQPETIDSSSTRTVPSDVSSGESLNIPVQLFRNTGGVLLRLGRGREQQGSVGSTEPERVGDGRSYRHLPRGSQWRERAFEQRVRLLQVERRRRNSMVDG